MVNFLHLSTGQLISDAHENCIFFRQKDGINYQKQIPFTFRIPVNVIGV